MQPDGTVVAPDGAPLGKLREDGMVVGPDGTVLAFAIFCHDLPRRAKIPRADRERPQGARGWNSRARRLQHALLGRWAVLYGT